MAESWRCFLAGFPAQALDGPQIRTPQTWRGHELVAGADDVEPRGLGGTVAPIALLDGQRSAAPEIHVAWQWHVARQPEAGMGRMLEDDAPAADRRDSGGSAAAIDVRDPGIVGVAAPADAGRVSDDRPRAGVRPGVPLRVPELHAGDLAVVGVAADVEGRDRWGR